LFRRLAKEYDITILADGGKFSRPVESIDGLSYVNLSGRLVRARVILRFLRELARTSDLVIDHGDVAVPWFTPLFTRKPRVTIIHQLVREIFFYEFPEPLSGLGYLSEKALYQLYARSRIVAASQSTADDLLALGIPRERIAVIAPGCSNISSAQVPLSERSQWVIGCVSRLVHYKGIQYALKAMANVINDHPDARLEIAGIGPYQVELQRIVHRLGIGRNISFLGRISEDRKFRLYSESRAMISPSIKEGYGISVIEANSLGTPVVGWNVSGLRDSIKHNRTGLLAPFPDEDKLAECLELVLTDNATWERLSDAAWKWAQTHSWDVASDDFRKVIVEALDKS